MNKKVLIGAIIVVVIIAAIVGIAMLLNNTNNDNTNRLADSEVNNVQESANNENTNNTQQNNQNISNTQTTSDKKILIAYFSETGNTDKFANIIHNQIGGDMLKIEPVTPYPQGQELFERDNDGRSEIKGSINIADYDRYLLVIQFGGKQVIMCAKAKFEINNNWISRI